MARPLERAYSFLTIKSIDEGQRIIEGIASTPEPDRTGDIVEPLGVTFKNPLPLLLHHDTTRPVGTVRFDPPTKSGITFSARLATVTEPGALKDRVDEAWQSIKARLLTAVSIGFVPLHDAVDYMKDTGGMRFRESELLELSLVTVPANADARIQVIKSHDVGRPVAPDRPRVPSNPAGVPASSTRILTMKTISEQLTLKKADLKTKSARLEELHGADTLDAAQTEERDTLTGELDVVTRDVERLEVLERAQATQARPIAVAGPTRSSASPHSVEVVDPLPKGIEYARLVICQMAGYLSHQSPIDIAKARYPDHPRIQTLLKAAIAPGTTTDTTWAGNLVLANTLVSEFIEYLRPLTILGKFGTGNIPSLRRVPFNVRMIGQTSGGAGYWVGQTAPKPLTKYDFEPTTLYWAKAAAIAVISDELARFSNPSAEALVRDALAGSIVERLDVDFVDPDKAVAANVSPASITNTANAIPASGVDAAAVRTDLAALIQKFIDDNIDLAQGVFIMPNAVALQLSLMRNALGNREFPGITMKGGDLEGFPVITSQYASFASPLNNLVILAAANEIFLSDDGQMTVDVSREASLEMESAPNGIGSPQGAVVSMFQSNLIALRSERYINWAKRRTGAAQYLLNVEYSAVQGA